MGTGAIKPNRDTQEQGPSAPKAAVRMCVMHNYRERSSLASAAQRLLNDQLEELVRASIQRLREADLVYQQVSNKSLNDQMRKTISLTLMRITGEPIPVSLASVAFETGQLRAIQRVDLQAVLRSFRIDLRVLWEAFLADAQVNGLGDNAAYLSELVGVWEAIEANINEVSEGYRTATDTLNQQTIELRTAVFHRLLDGSDVDSRIASKLLSTLTFDPSESLFCVVVDLHESEYSVLSACQARLSQRGIKNYFSWHGRYLVGFIQSRAVNEDFLMVLLTEFREYKTGFTEVRIPTTVRRAVDNTRTLVAALKSPGLHKLRQNWLTALTYAEPTLSRAIADDVLFKFEHLTPYVRGELLDTIQAFFDTDGTVNVISKTTFRHRNTVRSRLAQIEELTGLRLNFPRDIAVLAIAFSSFKLED